MFDGSGAPAWRFRNSAPVSPAIMAAPRVLSNKAAVLHGIDDLRLQDWPMSDELAPGRVRPHTGQRWTHGALGLTLAAAALLALCLRSHDCLMP